MFFFYDESKLKKYTYVCICILVNIKGTNGIIKRNLPGKIIFEKTEYTKLFL